MSEQELPLGDDIVPSSLSTSSMSAFVEALEAFEPGFAIVRNQPPQADQREPILASR